VILCLLAGVRGLMWIYMQHQTRRGEVARQRLRVIGLATLGIIAGAVLLVSQVAPKLTPDLAQLYFMTLATCAIALATPLTPLPSTARWIYWGLGLPPAIAGVFAGNVREVGVASFNLMLCICILIYVLRIQERTFVEQVDLRLKLQAERERAEQAEQVALWERTQARSLAETDPLTGLANRRAFVAALSAERRAAEPACVMILDLDGFKPVNDTFGHEAGDALLKLVAERLLRMSRPGFVAARLGGDEFAVLLPGLSPAEAEQFGREIVGSLSQPYPIGDALISVSACCGIAVLSPQDEDHSVALRQADLALYQAKNSGRAGVELYSETLGAAVRRKADIEHALRAPDVKDEVELMFQPIVDLKSTRIVAFEALARWTHSRLGVIEPADFIPITEQMQMVESLSQTLLRRAAEAALRWRPEQRLSFNLSAVQLCSFGSSARVLRCLEEVGLPPERLQIEVTETAMMADFGTARANLAALQERGAKVVLDDFGSGFASISYLREMRFDGLKLDGSLVVAANSSEGRRLLKGVIELARAMGIPCVAEHVETAEQARLLTELDCSYGQGWRFGRPVDAQTAALLAHRETAVPGARQTALRKVA
jgi:diguanylate cyclase (GGDEF)-like protein